MDPHLPKTPKKSYLQALESPGIYNGQDQAVHRSLFVLATNSNHVSLSVRDRLHGSTIVSNHGAGPLDIQIGQHNSQQYRSPFCI